MRSQTMNVYPKTFSGLLDDLFGEQGQLNKLKEDFLDGIPKRNLPPVNILEKKDLFEIEMLVPGIAKEALQIEIKEDVLVVSYEHINTSSDEADSKSVKREFEVRSFKRSFTLNEILDADKINAGYENGILRITIPKKQQEPKLYKLVDIS